MKKETKPKNSQKEHYTAAIVLARCSVRKMSYGIRWESSKPRRWIANWAFAIKESSARREGYDKVEIDGNLDFDPNYPGCPYCKAKGLLTCRCGKSFCWDETSEEATCPWCGKTSFIGFGGGGGLAAGNDR